MEVPEARADIREELFWSCVMEDVHAPRRATRDSSAYCRCNDRVQI